MKIIVGGVLSLPPYSPGIAWDWLQITLGFRELGHDVYYVEEVEPDWCFDRNGQKCDYLQSWNRELFKEMMERFDLLPRACQLYNRGEMTLGLSRPAITEVARNADLIVNMSGHVKADFILDPVRRRAYVDQDPVYTQLWHAEYGEGLDFDRHDIFFSVGLNIGTPATPIPDCGLTWHPLLPAVFPQAWPNRARPDCKRFTTLASWSGYSDLLFDGQWYRSKYHEFMRFADLPKLVDQELELCLKNYRMDDPSIQKLLANGWVVSDAGKWNSLGRYQEFIATSRAEIGIAQNAYVQGKSGWFSDRASHYLISGKPVLAQATGFEQTLSAGKGLLVFSNVEEAVEGINRINKDYDMHCRAAREFALEHLSYEKILPGLLEACRLS